MKKVYLFLLIIFSVLIFSACAKKPVEELGACTVCNPGEPCLQSQTTLNDCLGKNGLEWCGQEEELCRNLELK